MREISPREIRDNTMNLIADDWFLLCAGNEEKYNMMTASWAMLGHIWNKDVCQVFIRPQRYSYEFFEQNDTFAVCVLPGERRDILNLCGTKSGRDIDKMGLLTPVFEQGTVYFKEARLVLVCKKLYAQNLEEGCFVDTSVVDKCYPKKDFHRAYVGEIIKVLSE